jgi:uncharacterized protein (TIGR02246 family)
MNRTTGNLRGKEDIMARSTLIAVSLALCLTLSAFAGESGIGPQKTKEVKNFLDRQIQAFANRDLKGLMGMLASEASVVMLGNGPDDRWVGPAAIKKAYESQIAQYQSETIKLESTSIGAKGDIAWFATQARVVSTTKADRQRRFRINWTGVLEKRKGKWLLVQSHFSFPVRKP